MAGCRSSQSTKDSASESPVGPSFPTMLRAFRVIFKRFDVTRASPTTKGGARAEQDAPSIGIIPHVPRIAAFGPTEKTHRHDLNPIAPSRVDQKRRRRVGRRAQDQHDQAILACKSPTLFEQEIDA